jgi:hypothetical protein
MNLRPSATSARALIAPILLAGLLSAGLASAAISDADKATARELTIAATTALDAKDFAGAADKFTRAEALFQAGGESVPPTISLGVARAHAALGKLVSAQEHYSKVAHEVVPPNASKQFTDAVAAAQQELPALAPRVPGVVVNVKGSDAPKVTIDDAPVPVAALGVRRAVDPGKHIVRATGVGVTPVEATVTLAEGKTETVNLELKPGPGGLPDPSLLPPPPGGPGVVGAPGGNQSPPPPVDSSAPTRRLVGFIGIGVGGAGLVMGAVTGGLALGKHSSLTTSCPGGTCPNTSSNHSDVDSYTLLGNLSTAGFVAGGALAVTGVILVVTAPKAAQQSALLPVVGPGFAGLAGKF